MTRAAFSALVLAVAILAWSAWGAWRVSEIASPNALTAFGVVDPKLAPGAEVYDLRQVLGTVDKDPFNPGRRRPAKRFVMPADVAAAAAATQSAAEVRVIGTAVATDGAGGFAMCALGSGVPRIVRVGERLGDWTLNRVTKGAAEFGTSSGRTVIVRIATAGT